MIRKSYRRYFEVHRPNAQVRIAQFVELKCCNGVEA